MEILLIPLVLLIAGIIFYLYFRKVKKQYDNISRVERSSVDVIQENHEHFLIEFGKDTYQQYVELSGTVKSDNPLIAPVTGTSCVYAEHRITRSYEVQVQERDNQGRLVTRTQIRSDALSSNRQSLPFQLIDNEKEIEILPEGADIFPVQSYNTNVSSLDPRLAGKLGLSTSYPYGRTTGFHISEKIIPLGQPLYVLGEANDRTGKLAVSKPRDKAQSFILSTTQEDVLLQKLGSRLKWFRLGFLVSIILGTGTLILFILGLAGYVNF